MWYDFVTSKPEESTAYTYFTLQRVLRIADILQKPKTKRLARILEYSEGAKRAYRELVTKPKFSLDTDRQAKLVRPLYMGLLTAEQEDFAKNGSSKRLKTTAGGSAQAFYRRPSSSLCSKRSASNMPTSCWKTKNSRLALHAKARCDDHLGSVGGQRQRERHRRAGRHSIPQPLFQGRRVRMADERNVRHQSHGSISHRAQTGRQYNLRQSGISEHLRQSRLRVGKDGKGLYICRNDPIKLHGGNTSP